MAYCAYITSLKNIRKHSNADRLQCVEVFGQNVIVDLSYQDGQKVIFFPSDGQLSEEFANDNNLIRKKDENGNNIGGYMDPNKRNITAIRLRGEKSEGLVLPIEVLEKYTDISKLKDGDQITILNGHEICKKYIPHSNRRHNSSNNENKKGKRKISNETISYPFFEEHKDTAQLAYNLHAFKPGDTIYLTRKLHGTSARTGKMLKVTKKTNWFRRLLHIQPKIINTMEVVTGSRRVVLKNENQTDGYYSDNGFRMKYHNLLKDKLPEGLTVFYEIVGYVNESTPIMGTVSNKGVKDKEFTKKFGEQTIFSYGCNPGESEMYVYRMTITGSDGEVYEIPWETVELMCEKMGVNHVPDLEKFIFTTQEDLIERIKKYNDGMPADEIGKTHIAEGVVVRIDNRPSFAAYKDKVFEFKVVEGIAKDNSDVPDMEEAEDLIIDEV